MLNQVVLVGRLVKKPEIIETEDGKKRTSITLAVPRSFKNSNGEYDTDFINCTLWDNVATSTAEYCNKGDIVGVKGRLQTNLYQKDEKSKSTMNVIAEKVTFLTSRSKEPTQSDQER